MRAAAIFIALTFTAAPADAQWRRSGRENDRVQGVPAGHLPPPGECRVWYDDRPAGQQPPPTSCRDAERIAARDRYARVIYGDDRRDDRWDRDRDWRDRPRAVPRRHPYPGGYPYPERYPYPGERDRYPERGPYGNGRDAYEGIPFENGYRDGHEKGEEDARDNDAFDPRRHGRYRSADRGYDRRPGIPGRVQGPVSRGLSHGIRGGIPRSRRVRSRPPA